MLIRSCPATSTIAVGLACLVVATAAHADSAQGVDTMLGAASNPTGLEPLLQLDPRGLGTFRHPVSHTPTGQLYNLPWTPPETTTTASGWTTTGYVDLVAIAGDGSSRNAKFREYKDIHNGVTLGAFAYSAERAADARYVDVFGGEVGRRDQYYGAQFGRYNDYRVRVFYDEIPHTFTNARTFYDGIGSNSLTLPAGLVAGNSSLSAIQSAANSAGEQTLALTRKRFGGRLDYTLSDYWKTFVSYSLERREGDRPFTGGMFFPIAIGPTKVGGISEFAEPIHYQTHDILAGVQYADRVQQFNVSVGASLFRNDNASLTWQNPFNIGSVAPPGQANALNFREGQFALYPDNDSYFVKGEYARSFPQWWNGRVNATVSLNRMTQNADLLAPQTNTGLGGAVPPFYNLSNWNTTAALGRQKSEARIDTKLFDVGLSAQPADKLTLRTKVRYYETDNRTGYTAFNPLTGQYGYLAMGGAQGTIIPGESGIYNGTNNVQFRSIPFDGHQINYQIEGDYRIAPTTTVTAGLEREEFLRHYRERDKTRDNRFKLAVSSRALEAGTVRLSYEYGNRRGSEYHYDPYTEFYTKSLAGYSGAATESPLTLADLRKFDVADRKQQIFNARFNYMLTEVLDGSITLQSKVNDYPASYGRIDKQRQNSINVDATYTPTTDFTSYAFYSYQQGRLRQANINDNANNIFGSADAGGPVYPLANAWQIESRDRDHVFGLGLTKVFRNGMSFDTKVSLTRSRTSISYSYATPGGAALGDATAPVPDLGSSYPNLTYRELTLESGLYVPITKRISSRYFARFERIGISDWHYFGFNQDLMLSSNAGTGLLNGVYADPGPASYHNFIIGVMLQYRM